MHELDHIIWQLVASIPKGKVATYGQIAKMAGYPNHARYVGTILKNLPSDSSLPWHRIVNARGALSFPYSSDQFQQQKSLLESEGIEFSNGKLSLKKFAVEK